MQMMQSNQMYTRVANTFNTYRHIFKAIDIQINGEMEMYSMQRDLYAIDTRFRL